MRRTSLLLALCCLLSAGAAVFSEDAYQTDYHHELLGRPQTHTTFFHKPYAGSKASLVYTLSDQLVVGAVNPRDGSLVWRQALAHGSTSVPEGFLRSGEEQDTVVSGAGHQVAAWSASDGKLAWEANFPEGFVQDLEVLEQATVAETDPKDVIALFNGSTPALRRLDGKTGELKWTFEEARYG
jgi:ER membrane protein complex subunit 1